MPSEPFPRSRKSRSRQESIPVGCALPTFLVQGGQPNPNPLPCGGRPFPVDTDSFSPWMQTPFTLACRAPPPDVDPFSPWMQTPFTPACIPPPQKNRPLCHGGRPLEGTWDQAARHKVTSYRDSLLL